MQAVGMNPAYLGVDPADVEVESAVLEDKVVWIMPDQDAYLKVGWGVCVGGWRDGASVCVCLMMVACCAPFLSYRGPVPVACVCLCVSDDGGVLRTVPLLSGASPCCVCVSVCV